MVSIQAQTMRRVMPQRTAVSRREAPTPTMAPVMVWVVLTGMPKMALATIVMPPAVSADNPTGKRREKDCEGHADKGREENEKHRLDPALENQGLIANVRDGGAAIAAHERVRGTRRQAKNQRGEVPGDGPEKTGKNHLLVI